MDYPLVTVGIASFNNSDYIIETLESVKNQSYTNIQVIIVDDCSSDNSIELLRSWLPFKELDIELKIHEKNKGIVAVAKTILDMAKGKYYQILGSDDTLEQNKIKEQVELLETLPSEYCMVYSDVKRIDESSKILSQSYLEYQNYNTPPSGIIFKELIHFNFIPAMSVLVKTEVAKSNYAYEHDFPFEDYVLWLKLAHKYKIAFLDKRTANYRIKRESQMHTEKINITFIEAELNCIYSYLNFSVNIKKEIVEKIRKLSIILYKENSKVNRLWLKRGFIHSFNFKMFILFVLSSLGINIFDYRQD